ncbi:MAG: GC-type dockerin domain-anchored protein [Planctomycetota bacterium]
MNLTTRRAAAAAMFAGLAVSTASAQIFQREIGDISDEWSYSVDTTEDGGSVSAGYKRVNGLGSEFHVIKYFPDGTTEWEVTFGGEGEDIAYSVQETKDGGYIVAGESTSFGTGFEIVLLRLDAGGTQLWSYAYEGSFMADPIHAPHPGVALDQGDEGEIYVVGHRASPTGFPFSTPVAFRTDSIGTLEWYNEYVVPTPFQEFPELAFTDIAYSPLDRTAVISGTIRADFPLDPNDPTFLGRTQDATLLKVTADDFAGAAPGGAPVWFFRYDSLFDRDNPDLPNVWETGDGLDVFREGDIILAGRTDLGLAPSGTYRSTHLVHVDAGGGPIWSVDYESFGVDGTPSTVATAYAAVEFDERRDAFVQAGRITSASGGGVNAHTQLTAFGGAPIWSWRYGLDDFRTYAESVQPSIECGYTYAGRIDNPNPPSGLGRGDHYLVANNDDGMTGCLEEEVFVEPVAPLRPRELPIQFDDRFEFLQLPNLTRPVDGFNFALCFDPDCDPGTGPCNAADIAPPFGVLDLDDVNAFIVAFFAMTPAADIAPPFGVWDLDDINLFIAAFLAGCP